MDLSNYLSKREAANRAGVNERSIDRWIKAGEFDAGKIGQTVVIDRASFEKFLKRRKEARAKK